MKTNRLFVTATVLGGLFVLPLLSAATVISDIAVGQVPTIATAPVPLQVIAPTGIARRFEGETIRLRLTIDEAGRPQNVSLQAGSDHNLIKHLLPAVAQWKFRPALRDGRPVAVEVVLPLALVDRSNS